MALQGPFIVVADSPAPDLVEALRAAGAFPIVESSWAEAADALTSVQPDGILLAEPTSDRKRAAALTQALAHRLEAGKTHSFRSSPASAMMGWLRCRRR